MSLKVARSDLPFVEKRGNDLEGSFSGSTLCSYADPRNCVKSVLVVLSDANYVTGDIHLLFDDVECLSVV